MEPSASQNYGKRALVCLLLLFSPLGAPAVGAMLTACPEDTAIIPQGPFAMPFSSCGIWPSAEQLYQTAVFLPTVALRIPLVGILIMLAWWGLALALPLVTMIHIGQVFANRVTNG